MEDNILFGYCINDIVLIDISRQQIVRLDGHNSKIQCTSLRDTMMRLLLYILQSAPGDILTNNEILFHVWDRHHLSSSTQRLWQVMKALKEKLISMGVPDDLIMRIETRGFCVNHAIVTPLYLRSDCRKAGSYQESNSEI